MPAPTQHRVVVIGAGYAGILAANRVRASLKRSEAGRVSVVMVNPTGDFVDRVRLHEVAAGVRSTAAIPLGDMLHDRIDVIVGSVLEIDAAHRSISVAADDGVRVEPYDTLVYAVGSMAALGVPGAAQFAHPSATPTGRHRPGGRRPRASPANESSWSAEGRPVSRRPPNSPSSTRRRR
jgi:NADH dehydrogenase